MKCVFVGYSRTQKGYRCFRPLTRRYIVFADVTFFESKSFFESVEPPSSSPIREDMVESVPFPPPVSVQPVLGDDSQQAVQQQSFTLQVYSRRARPPVPPTVETNPTSTSTDPSDSDLPLPYGKVNVPLQLIPSSPLLLMIIFIPPFASLLFPYLQSLVQEPTKKLFFYHIGNLPWMKK